MNSIDAASTAVWNILSQSVKPSTSKGIDELRGLVLTTPNRLSASELHLLVEKIVTLESLASVAATLGIPESAVISEITQLGTRLSQAHGAGTVTFELPGPTQLQLFVLPGEAPQGAPVHSSFLPTELGRDIKPSLSAIITHRPDNDELALYEIRRNKEGADKYVRFETCTVLGFFARVGRIDEVALVNEQDPVFHQVLLSAWDMLDIARIDAVRGLASLVGVGDYNFPFEEAKMKAAPVFWREVSDVEKAEMLGGPADVEKTRRIIHARILANPDTFVVPSVGDLTVAHIAGICTANGIVLERDINAERAARKLLAEMGFTSRTEVDALLHDATRAVETNTVDAFKNEVLSQMSK